MIRKVGAFIWKAYLNHLLWFTIGAIAGSIQTFIILAGMWGPR